MNLLIKYFIFEISSKRKNKSHCDNREIEHFAYNKDDIKKKNFQ